MKNRLFSLLSIMLLCLSVLSGCGSREAYSDNAVPDGNLLNNSKEKVLDREHTVIISGWLEDGYTRNLLAYLAEKHPEYKFEYEYIGKRSYESIIDAELASKEAADIVMVNSGMAEKHGKNGYIVDMSQYCNNFTDEAKAAFSYKGSMYAVPNTSEYQCIFYNRDMVEKFGRTLPSRFQDFLNYCDEAREELGIQPLICGIKDYNRIIEKNPSMRIGTTVAPAALNGTAILIGGCNSAFAVNAYGTKKDDVIGIVADLASEEGQRALWEDRVGSQTYLKDVEFDNPPVFEGLKPAILAHQVYMPVSEWGEHGSQMYEILGRELQKVVSGERNVDIAVKVMDYEINQIFKMK